MKCGNNSIDLPPQKVYRKLLLCILVSPSSTACIYIVPRYLTKIDFQLCPQVRSQFSQELDATLLTRLSYPVVNIVSSLRLGGLDPDAGYHFRSELPASYLFHTKPLPQHIQLHRVLV